MPLVYLEDVIVFSRNQHEHMEHLYSVLTFLEDAGIKLKIETCVFVNNEVKYLGHCIRAVTVSVY